MLDRNIPYFIKQIKLVTCNTLGLRFREDECMSYNVSKTKKMEFSIYIPFYFKVFYSTHKTCRLQVNIRFDIHISSPVCPLDRSRACDDARGDIDLDFMKNKYSLIFGSAYIYKLNAYQLSIRLRHN